MRFKLFEEFGKYTQATTWDMFMDWLHEKDFDLYDGTDDLHNKFFTVIEDNSLIKEEKAKIITNYLEDHWGLYDGYTEVLEYLENLL